MVSAAGIFNFVRPYFKAPTNDSYIWQTFVIYGYLSQRGNSAFLQILALRRFAPTLNRSKWNSVLAFEVNTFCLVCTWQADKCRSQWPCRLRRWSAAARSLGLRVRIPPSTCMSFSSSIGVLPSGVCVWFCVRACVCVSLSVIKCSSNPLHMQWAGRNRSEEERKHTSLLCHKKSIVCGQYRSVPWPSVRIVGTRSQWSGKLLASEPEYEVLPSKPVVGTVRQLLAGILVQSFVKCTSRGKVAMCKYHAYHDEAGTYGELAAYRDTGAHAEREGAAFGQPSHKIGGGRSRFLHTQWYETFTWFSLQPKSATEIGRWLVLRNFRKVK